MRKLYSQPAFRKYAEDDDDEDYEDLFAKPVSGAGEFSDFATVCSAQNIISDWVLQLRNRLNPRLYS